MKISLLWITSNITATNSVEDLIETNLNNLLHREIVCTEDKFTRLTGLLRLASFFFLSGDFDFGFSSSFFGGSGSTAKTSQC